jgi:hypothetical protein
MYDEQHPVSRRWAVFDDEGDSAWLYLTERDEPRPIADCWVYNRVPAPQPAEIARYRGGPPPACIGHAGPDARYQGPEPPVVRFLWSPDGESVAVWINGRELGYIVSGGRRGFSRHLLQAGPWGQPWDEPRYRAVFPNRDD